MGVLEEVMQMKGQGMSNPDISSNLRQRGVAPRAIQDALGQAQIKMSISSGANMESETQEMNSNYDQMQPSIMNSQQNQTQYYQPQTQEMEGETDNQYPPQQNQQDYYAPQEPQQGVYQDYAPGYDQNAYNDYGANAPYAPSTGIDTDTVFEVAEQVFSDKIKDINKKIEELTEIKTIMQTKVEHIDKRLDRIESIIDKLQASILHKIGSYGDNLESIKDEMSMMQDSMSKMFSGDDSNKLSTRKKK